MASLHLTPRLLSECAKKPNTQKRIDTKIQSPNSKYIVHLRTLQLCLQRLLFIQHKKSLNRESGCNI